MLAAGAVSRAEHKVTVLGDAAAFAAAVAVVAYLQIGNRLRTYQPTFIYAAPVTAIAAILLSIAGYALEDHSLVGAHNHGVVGWLCSRHYAPYVVYLAVVPGIIGHTGFNTVLKYVSPLMVSLAIQLEPMLGSVIGWLLGVMTAPGTFTYLGGAIVLVSTVIVTVSTARREAKQNSKLHGSIALAEVFDHHGIDLHDVAPAASRSQSDQHSGDDLMYSQQDESVHLQPDKHHRLHDSDADTVRTAGTVYQHVGHVK